MALSACLLAILACLLVAAAVTDLRSRIISNRLNLAIAALAPVYWWLNGYALWPDAAIQIGMAVAVFALFAALFALGVMGGGDVKMLAALALWFSPGTLLAMLMLMALLGGAVTLVTMVHHRLTKRSGAPEIPYGVAIALAALWFVSGALWAVGERYFNQFA